MNKILNSLNTITSDFLLLSKKQKTKNLKISNLLKIYFTTLRPGTYDITVKRAIPSIKKKN